MIKWPYFLEFHAKLCRSYEIACFNNLNDRIVKQMRIFTNVKYELRLNKD